MSARHRIPELSPEGRAAAAALRRAAAGVVSRRRSGAGSSSTDASSYRLVPDAVLVASSIADLHAAAAIAAEYGVPLVARGAATSVAGQAVGPGIAVDCFKLDRILAIDPEGRTARVEPGVIQASLNRAAAAFGLEFGPDTSTVDQATIGGMVGNNSSGSRSIVYGGRSTKWSASRPSLRGRRALVFGSARPTRIRQWADGAGGGRAGGGARGGPRALSPAARRGLSAHSALHVRLQPAGAARAGAEPGEAARRVRGHAGAVHRARGGARPPPAARVGAALTFATLRAALEANVAILETGPSAVELLDLDPLRAAPNLAAFARMAPLLAGDARAMLTVEYQGSADEARPGSADCALAGDLGATRLEWLEDPAALAEAGALRRAVLPLLMGAPGAERPASFVEDTAVAPERLAGFVDEFERLVAAEGARASFTGHASAGCMHIRPLLDLKSAAGVRRMETLAAAVGRLVAEYHGAISGEHGVGRSRSWSLPGLLGPDLYAAMVAVKDAFDPRRLLGPGAIVDGPAVAESLRYGADYRGDGAWAPRLSYAAEGGFDLAVEKCFGAGLCKKLDGTMCPPAAASRSEEGLATRARANALQALVGGAVHRWRTSARPSSTRSSAPAWPARRSARPAWTWRPSRSEWLAELRAKEGMPSWARDANFGDVRAGVAVRCRRQRPRPPAARQAGHATGRRGAAAAAPAFARRPLTRRVTADGARRGRAVRRLFRAVPGAARRRGAGEPAASCRRRAGARRRRLLRAHRAATGHDKARAAAATALAGPARARARGRDLLFIEPSCLAWSATTGSACCRTTRASARWPPASRPALARRRRRRGRPPALRAGGAALPTPLPREVAVHQRLPPSAP